MSRTLSGLFLVGALNRPRKRKRTNRENPRTIPAQIGKIPEKSGKSQKGRKRTKKDKKGQKRTKKKRKRGKKEERKRKEREKKEKKVPKRTKKDGQVQIGKPPLLKHPRLAALDNLKQDLCHGFAPYIWDSKANTFKHRWGRVPSWPNYKQYPETLYVVLFCDLLLAE